MSKVDDHGWSAPMADTMRDAVASTVDLLLSPYGGPEHLFRMGAIATVGLRPAGRE